MDGISKETEKWGNALLHPNKQKHGRVPRPAGQKEEETIPRAEPSHGTSRHSDKDNSHSRAYGKYPKGKKVSAGGDDHEG